MRFGNDPSPLLFAQSLYITCGTSRIFRARHPNSRRRRGTSCALLLVRITRPSETMSLDDPRTTVKERRLPILSAAHATGGLHDKNLQRTRDPRPP